MLHKIDLRSARFYCLSIERVLFIAFRMKKISIRPRIGADFQLCQRKRM